MFMIISLLPLECFRPVNKRLQFLLPVSGVITNHIPFEDQNVQEECIRNRNAKTLKAGDDISVSYQQYPDQPEKRNWEYHYDNGTE